MEHCSDGIDKIKVKILNLIKEVGWTVQGVLAGEGSPSYCYTIGLEESFGHPELVVWGLSPDVAHHFFHDLVEGIKEGKPVPVGEKITDLTQGDLPMIFYPIDIVHLDELNVLKWFLAEHAKKKDISPPLQMIWTDPKGLFPWDAGFDERFRNHQPEWWKIEDVDQAN